jgi:hypothetical protein
MQNIDRDFGQSGSFRPESTRTNEGVIGKGATLYSPSEQGGHYLQEKQSVRRIRHIRLLGVVQLIRRF